MKSKVCRVVFRQGKEGYKKKDCREGRHHGLGTTWQRSGRKERPLIDLRKVEKAVGPHKKERKLSKSKKPGASSQLPLDEGEVSNDQGKGARCARRHPHESKEEKGRLPRSKEEPSGPMRSVYGRRKFPARP